MRLAILVLIAAALPAMAQPPISGQAVTTVTVDPSGACYNNLPMDYNIVNGNYWGCQAGVWTKVTANAAAVPNCTTLSGAAVTVLWATSACSIFTPGGNATIAFTAPASPGLLRLQIVRGSSAATLTWTGGGTTILGAPTWLPGDSNTSDLLFSYNGTTFDYQAGSCPQCGYGSGTEVAFSSLPTPPSGVGVTYFDSTSHTLGYKTSAGAQALMPLVAACTNQVVTALTSTGAPLCATITSAYVDSSVSKWSGLTAPTANLTLSTGTNTSEFDGFGGWTWKNPTAATSGAAADTPPLKLCGNGWSGSASVLTCTTIGTQFNGPSQEKFIIQGSGSPDGTNNFFVVAGFANVIFDGGAVTSAYGWGVQQVNWTSSSYGSNVAQFTSGNRSGGADVSLAHVIGASAAPAGVLSTGSGTSGAATIAGNDSAFNVTLTTGATPTASATIVTVTFALGWINIAASATAPHCSLTPLNAATALLSGVSAVYPTPSATTLTLTAGPTALLGGTAYSWDVLCTGSNQ